MGFKRHRKGSRKPRRQRYFEVVGYNSLIDNEQIIIDKKHMTMYVNESQFDLVSKTLMRQGEAAW